MFYLHCIVNNDGLEGKEAGATYHSGVMAIHAN